MRLTVAGKDRSLDLGAQVVREAASLDGTLSPWSEHDSALSLRDSKSPSDYFETFTRLMRFRHEVSTNYFYIPSRPGWVGNQVRKVKWILWRVMRYQHDRMAFQQNIINELVVSAVDFQQAALFDRVADLERKVKHLEAELETARKGARHP